MKYILAPLTIICLSFSGIQLKEKSAPLSFHKLELKAATKDTVVNTSFVASNGERFLRLEMVVNESIQNVWDVFATEEGMKTWIAPVIQADFRIGGKILTNYDKNAKIGDEGTIELGIIQYIPLELLTYKVNLNSVFAEKCQNEDGDLQEIVQFESIGKNKTKIISTMVGWKTGKEWDDTYAFFTMGNTWTYKELFKRFTSGPVKW